MKRAIGAARTLTLVPAAAVTLRRAAPASWRARACVLSAVVGLALVAAPSASAYFYWTDYGGTSIGRANLNGTGVENNFITGLHSPCGIAVDSRHIYWANFGGTTIGRANLNGTGVNDAFVTGLHSPCGVAVTRQYIYWSDYGNGTLGRANLDGSGVNDALVAGLNTPCGVAVGGTRLYWASENGGTIGRADLDGSDPQPSFISGGADTCGVALNSSHLYWANGAPGNTLGTANLDGTGVNEDLLSTPDPCFVALGSSNLYWSSTDTGILSRANLDGSNPTSPFIGGATANCGVAIDSLVRPTVIALSPKSGPAAGGTKVTITGAHLAGASKVMFGAESASFTVVSSTEITAISPDGTGRVKVRVITPGGMVGSIEFQYVRHVG